MHLFISCIYVFKFFVTFAFLWFYEKQKVKLQKNPEIRGKFKKNKLSISISYQFNIPVKTIVKYVSYKMLCFVNYNLYIVLILVGSYT